MALLIITTILWAFSFSLIGEYLAGSVDSYFSVLMRVGLAALVFLPFLRTRGQSPRTIVLYMLVGAMQLGIMYLLAFRAYIYLTVSEFLLFTVFTPLYITLIYDLLSGRKLRWGYLLSAALAVLGAAIIRYDKVSDHFWTGLLLVQLSNLCFAIGMVGYKRLMEVRPMPQHNAFAWFYVGPLSWRWRRGLCSATPRSCRPPRCSGACWCGSAWWLPGWVTLCGTMAPPRWMPARWGS
ncbi:transporter 10 TMS drug/metabolite exporter (DME) family [Klebsiella pneumoniae]|uniref:Transporter 10 TMS drug/metabolite exporter (DME) family n=1 Tax=Klebsiella pneumoniae TaxID=573 RepID=A0A377ZQR9_KLEPN|nr:transporter 10 TMS drug/metabolite exporter (DME) family [Klebsiella pneumoniae]